MLPTFAVLLLAVPAGWFMYQMLLQQGRFQIRLETLERDLQESRIGLQPGSIGSQGGVPRHSLLPDFQLPVIGGGVTSLSSYRGRKVLLIFFNPRCSYSMHLALDLQRINSRRIQQEPLPVVVSTGDSLDNERLFGNFPIASSVLLQVRIRDGYSVSCKGHADGIPDRRKRPNGGRSDDRARSTSRDAVKNYFTR
jgi:hypothetical protein